MPEELNNLYIFIDESGNFDFSDSGTNHFVICAYSTTNPQQHTLTLQELKYKLLTMGHDQECFHATEDKQFIRDEVYKVIKTTQDGIYDMVYIEKNKTHPVKQNKKDIYTLLVGTLLSYIFGRIEKQKHSYEQVIVVIDQTLTKKEQGYLKQIIKPKLKATNRPYRLFFFQTKSDPNAQVADYGAWGKYVSLERNEQRPINEVKHLLANDFDVFRTGTKRYY
jgi:hypothetical protein